MKSDSTSTSPPPPMRSESYLSIQEKLFEHARRCSTGETTGSTTRLRRQSESTVRQRSPEKVRSKMRMRTQSESTARQPSPEARTAGSVFSEKLTKCSNASPSSDSTQTASDASKNEVGGKQAESSRALSEKERQRRELDNIVDSLPVPQFADRVKRSGVGMCPFAGGDLGNDGDSMDDSSDVNGHSGNTDLVCPVTGVVKEQSKVTRDTSKPGSSLLRAVTRSISSHSKDDWWNSVMCANSADASSQEVSSDEELPPLIHHEHLTYTSPLAGQRVRSASKGKASSEQRVPLTNGVCVSSNISDASKDTNVVSHNRSDVTPDISISGNDEHSSESSLNAHKLVEGCQSLCNHASTHSLMINGSVKDLCQRTRSNTISTAYKHATSPSGSCDCLLQRRHSASGELSKACDGRPEFSELEADLMSFSSVANIHGCCAFDGGVAKRNLLDASLPDLPYY